MGMEQALAARGSAVRGILNGVDYQEWDPRRDQYLPIHFGANDLVRKAELKRNFLLRQNMRPTQGASAFGIVSRLTSQKGFDLLIETLPKLLATHDVRIAAVGTGDPVYEKFFTGLAERHRGRVWFFAGYDESLAHWIEGASDIFLMPSLYEPCGLNQMYSLRYGTIPSFAIPAGCRFGDSFDPATGSAPASCSTISMPAPWLGARQGAAMVCRSGALATDHAERDALRFLVGDAVQRIPEAVRRTTSA